MSDLPPVPSPTVAGASKWWDKINWTQGIGFICSILAILTGNKFSVSPEIQLAIVAAIQGVQALLTVILNRG